MYALPWATLRPETKKQKSKRHGHNQLPFLVHEKIARGFVVCLTCPVLPTIHALPTCPLQQTLPITQNAPDLFVFSVYHFASLGSLRF